MILPMHTGFRLVAGLLPLLAGASAFGQDDEDKPFDRTPQDCVITSRIDQTEAVDDQNIIFRMRGKQVYRNTLPRTCPGLLRENRIAWETSTARLCNIDTITVLENYGVGFRPGFTCRLGEFVPLSPAEVEDMDLRKKGEAGQNAIETSQVEVERDDGDADASQSESESETVPADEPPPAPTDAEN